MSIPNEITTELDLTDAIECKDWQETKKDRLGVFGKELRFAYQWKKENGNLIGYDAASGVKFGEYTFGDNMKEDACIEAVAEFENDTDLACCAVTYRDRSLLCFVDLSLSKVMHGIKIMRYPITCLTVIKDGSSLFTDKQRVHPQLRAAKGIMAAGQVGGKIFLIDVAAKHTNWWKHTEVNPTSLAVIKAQDCDDQNIVQQVTKASSTKGDHVAIVLDGSVVDRQIEVTAIEFCEEPMILIAGYDYGHFDIWSLVTLQMLHGGEILGSPISHIMSMLPEDDPRKLVYVWVVEDGSTASFSSDNSITATANLFVLSYKPKLAENSATGYEEIDTVNSVFQLFFDSVEKGANEAEISSCLSVCPISIDISNKYMSTLNCTGLCSFIWSANSSVLSPIQYNLAIFDLGRWYAEEMPKQARVSDLSVRSSSYLANSHLDITNPEKTLLLDAKVCNNGTKKYIWALNEEVTSYVAATSFSMMVLTSGKILQFSFPGIQSYLFDKIDCLPLCQLMQPHGLFFECLSAGLMPDGMFDKKKTKVLEAIYELAINHNLLRFLRRCASEFFDGKYESAGLSTQHLFEWAWKKALDVKKKSDALLGLLYSGHEMTLSDKNSHCQFVNDLRSITQLFQHVEKEKLLHTAEGLQGLRLRIRGLELVNEYLKCVQYFATCTLLPDTSENGQQRLSVLREEYAMRRKRDSNLMVDLLVERFGDNLKELWSSHGGDGKYPPPSMQSILATVLLDTADPSDKHCLLLYFLLDLTKFFNINTSLDLGYKEMNSSSACLQQVATSQFLWYIDHNKLQDALKSVETEKLDASWIDTTYSHLYTKFSSKEIFDVYRCIGFGTDTMDKKKFVIHLFVENGLVIPGFQWTRKNCINGFEPHCFAFFLDRVHGANGLAKLVAKELNLKPKESTMLYDFLKMHRLGPLINQLEEKIGSANFVPCPELSDQIFSDISDFQVPEKFAREMLPPIESEEVQKLLKGSFVFVKHVESTPLQRHVFPLLSKPSILKASDSPAASPLHLSSVGVTPSPKRLRFQLPQNANVSSSSEDSSPVSEGLLHYEFETPKASTPKSKPATEPSEPAEESFFEFASPSEVPQLNELECATGVKFEDFDSPIISSSIAVGQIDSSGTNIDSENLDTSAPNEVEDILEVEIIPETAEENSDRDQEMLTDEEESNIDFVSFVTSADVHEQEPEKEQVVLSHVMEISEDEEEQVLTLKDLEEDQQVVGDESFTSATSESFFSTVGNYSLNSSNISYTSALDSTLKEEDSEDDSICPITKKRRSEVFEDGAIASTDMVEVDDLSYDQLSPSKFWNPPPLTRIAEAGEPCTSTIDLSYLPKPPLRPSPRKPVHRVVLQPKFDTEFKETEKDEFEALHLDKLKNDEACHLLKRIPREAKEESPSAAIGESSNQAGFSFIEEPILDTTTESLIEARVKRHDSVFHRTIDSSFERDMQVIEEEKNAKTKIHVGVNEDSDDDLTLDQTVIVLSSGSSLDSPVTALQKSQSPQKPIKMEQISPESLTQDQSEEPEITSPLSEEPQLISPFKRFTRSDRKKDGLVEQDSATSTSAASVETTNATISIATVLSFEESTSSGEPEEPKEKSVEPTAQLSVQEPPSPEIQDIVAHETSPQAASLQIAVVSSPEAVEEGPSLPSPVGASKALETIISKQSTDFNESGNTDSANLASKATGAQSEPELHGEEVLPSETLPKIAKKVGAPLKIQKVLPNLEKAKTTEQKSGIPKRIVEKPKPTPKAAPASKVNVKKTAAKTIVKEEARPTRANAPKMLPGPASKKKINDKNVKTVVSKRVAEKRKVPEDEESESSDSSESSEEYYPRPTSRSKTARVSKELKPVVKLETEAAGPSKMSTRQPSKPQSKKQTNSPTLEKKKIGRPRKTVGDSAAKLTAENLKKFDKQMTAVKEEPSSSQESSSSVRRGRPRKNPVGAASRDTSLSPVPSVRELRSRSQSVASEKPAMSRVNTRSSSVVSEKSVGSQRSTRSNKRKADSDSDESTESAMELRRSRRKVNPTTEVKRRAGRKVSVIPEEK